MAPQQPNASASGDSQALSDRGAVATHSRSRAELDADLAVVRALGNETRYEILRLVADADGDVCVCELEPALAVSQSATSQALSRLHEVGLLTRRKDGRWRYYDTTDRAETLLQALDSSRRVNDDGETSQ